MSRVFVHDQRPATAGAGVHRIRRLVLQPLVRAFAVVKGEVLGEADQQLPHRGVAVEVHVLVLDVAP